MPGLQGAPDKGAHEPLALEQSRRPSRGPSIWAQVRDFHSEGGSRSLAKDLSTMGSQRIELERACTNPPQRFKHGSQSRGSSRDHPAVPCGGPLSRERRYYFFRRGELVDDPEDLDGADAPVGGQRPLDPGENAETVSLLITLGFLMRIKWKRLAKP
jgi:hypothetical protein